MDKSSIKKIRKTLKDNLLNDKQFAGYDKERKQIYDLIQRTIQNGESNSALLIGPRGSGKTTLVNDVLHEITEGKSFEKNALLVKLHGLIHTDDRHALKSVTSQMQLENAVDGKVFGSFAENLAFLLDCLRSGKSDTSKSVIFILEEFDLFCAHHNQTLLYNLFDTSQSAQTPLCILGITCRLDVIELLEKRVKSRFSHRQFFLFPGQSNKDENGNLKHALERTTHFLSITKPKLTTEEKEWNKHIKKLLTDKKVTHIIQRLIDIDLNEHVLKNMLLQLVSKLNESHPLLTFEDLNDQLKDFEKDDIVQVLNDLNILELCLVIAMKHHCEIYDNQPMNFEMVLTRYVKFANAHGGISTVQRPVILKAFEHIQNLELMSPVSSGAKIQKEYQLFKLLVTPQQLSEAVKKIPNLPTEVVQWANSSLA